VQVRVGGEHQRVSVAAAVTAGTLSSPGARTTNGGPQVSTRLAVRPATGLILAGSFADGRFFADDLAVPQPLGESGSDYSYTTTSTRAGRYHQQTWGADAEYSLGHFLARAELVSARWRLPAVGATPILDRLRSTGVSVEGRYRLAPGVTAGARVDHLSFSQLRGSYQELPWDAPVTRVEAGVAWAATRNLIVRGTVQHNDRSRGRVRHSTLPALQVTVWF
jgi:hypothetical protein